ncbi:MAG: hypothetical protein R3328_11625, partial [Planococcaceae bacterium]|nr:hypothetical protein [Planococcaceae bacterium]
EMVLGNRKEMFVEGFEINELSEKNFINKVVNINDFVPHQLSYFQFVIQKINERLISKVNLD